MGAIAAFLLGRRWLLPGVGALFALGFVPPFSREDLLRWLVSAAVLAALAVAFDFTAGYINIVNFGFAAFAGAGGYTSALLVVEAGLSPWLTLFVGAAVAAVLGLFTGVLTLRFRGIYAAVVAWFLGLALMGITRNLTDVTRGPLGLQVPNLLPTSSNRPYYFLSIILLVMTYIGLKAITETRAGLAFRAIGQNMDAARASGINPARYRIFNFTVSCMFAGLIGAFFAHYIGILTPEVMSTQRTVEVLVVAYVGGRGTLWGPAVAAFPLVFLTEYLRSSLSDLPGLNLVIYAVLLMAVMVFYPGGLAELPRTLARLRRGVERRLGRPAAQPASRASSRR
jgi:branched-chain amino acid transport system permease protein